MSFLIDTNIFVDVLRKREPAVSFFGQLQATPSTSVVCVAELMAGAGSQREERQILHLLLSHVKVLPATFEIAARAGSFVRHYRASHNVGLGDALIAATAEHHRLALATLNVKHFPMLEGLQAPY